MPSEVATIITADDKELQASCQRSERSLTELGTRAEAEVKRIPAAFKNAIPAMDETGQHVDLLDGVNKKAGKSISKMGGMVTGLGMSLNMVNPALAQTVTELGMMGSGLGQVVSSVSLTKTAFTSFMGLAANPLAQVALPALAVGLAAWIFRAHEAKEAADAFSEHLKRVAISVRELNRDLDAAGKATGIISGDLGAKTLEKATLQRKASDEDYVEFAKKKEEELSEARIHEAKSYNEAMAATLSYRQAIREEKLSNAGLEKLKEDWEKAKETYKKAKEAKEDLEAAASKTKAEGDEHAAIIKQKGLSKELGEEYSSLTEIVGHFWDTESQKRQAALAKKFEGINTEEGKKALADSQEQLRILGELEQKKTYNTMARDIEAATEALKGNSQNTMLAKAAQAGLNDEQTRALAVLEAGRVDAEKAKGVQDVISALKEETIALSMNSENYKINQLARQGASTEQQAEARRLMREANEIRESNSTFQRDIVEGSKRTIEETMTNQEKLNKRLAEIDAQRAANMSNPNEGISEDVAERAKKQAQEQYGDKDKDKGSSRAGQFEDATSMWKRMAGAHANAPEDRTAKATEKHVEIAKEHTGLLKRIADKIDTNPNRGQSSVEKEPRGYVA